MANQIEDPEVQTQVDEFLDKFSKKAADSEDTIALALFDLARSLPTEKGGYFKMSLVALASCQLAGIGDVAGNLAVQRILPLMALASGGI